MASEPFGLIATAADSPEKLMSAIPAMAKTKPTKNPAPKPPFFKAYAMMRPVNKGDVATITLTLEAVVRVRAVFSSMNARVTPQMPAAANSVSSRQPDVRNSLGRIAQSAT